MIVKLAHCRFTESRQNQVAILVFYNLKLDITGHRVRVTVDQDQLLSYISKPLDADIPRECHDVTRPNISYVTSHPSLYVLLVTTAPKLNP